MATVPAVTQDTIALTEKKMFMSLEDIIKMSKKMARKSTKKSQPSVNKRQGGHVYNAVKSNASKLKLRLPGIGQDIPNGVRSRIRGNRSSAVKAAARKAALAPVGMRSGQWNKRRNRNFRTLPFTASRSGLSQVGSTGKSNGPLKHSAGTLDSLFASMKVKRMRVWAQALTAEKRTFNIREKKSKLGENYFRAPQRIFGNEEVQRRLGGNGGNDFRPRQHTFDNSGSQTKLGWGNGFRVRQRAFDKLENQAKLSGKHDFRMRQRALNSHENFTKYGGGNDFRARKDTFFTRENHTAFGRRNNY